MDIEKRQAEEKLRNEEDRRAKLEAQMKAKAEKEKR